MAWEADSTLVAMAEEMASVHSKKVDLLVSRVGQWLATPEGWAAHPKVCEHMETFFYAAGTLFFLERVPVRKFGSDFGPVCDHVLEMVFVDLHLRSLPKKIRQKFPSVEVCLRQGHVDRRDSGLFCNERCSRDYSEWQSCGLLCSCFHHGSYVFKKCR